MNQDQFRKCVFDRAIELSKYIRTITGGVVYSGPFIGLKILPDYLWGDGDISSKLLGLYEYQLHKYIEDVVLSKPDCILNIGCAEGYYGIGLQKRIDVPSYLIDVDERYRDIVKKTAELNNVQDYYFSTNSSLNNFRTILNLYKNPFILMDCEGTEIEFLNLDYFPELLNSTILVETHDFLNNSITNTLLYRFSETHIIEEIHSIPKNMNLDIISSLSDLDKMVLWNEWRPCEMAWLYMKPKIKK